ncbi:lactonase family protein [Nostoc sp. CHAB 5844]|nr:lactonase family protein [Nostoc sp. CHAB 5844]
MLLNLVKNKALAQDARSLVGVRLSARKNKQDNKISTDVENTTPAVTLVNLDLTTGNEKLTTEIPPIIVDNQDTKSETSKKALYIETTRITGFTTLLDGTLVMVTVTTNQKGNFSKLIFTRHKSFKKPKSKKISGFRKSNNTIEGVLGIQDDKIIGIASYNNGRPPFYLVLIDPKNGKVTSGDQLNLPELPSNIRFNNLALSPDGKFYATILGSEGRVTLVKLDPSKKALITGRILISTVAELTHNRKYLASDLLSLTFSPSGQLTALANLNPKENNSVFAVDIKSGKMTLLSKVSVDKIAFAS